MEPSSPGAPPAPGKRTRKATRPRRVSATIGFRVDTYYHSLLARGASAYQISVHEYARQRLLELLDRQEEVRLLEEAALTRAAVEALREDLARSLELLMANFVPNADPLQLRAWIDANLRRG